MQMQMQIKIKIKIHQQLSEIICDQWRQDLRIGFSNLEVNANTDLINFLLFISIVILNELMNWPSQLFAS